MKNKGLFQRLMLGVVLGLGFLAVWVVVGTVALETIHANAIRHLVADSLSIRQDGTALIVHVEDGVSSSCDLNGVPVASSEDDSSSRFNGVLLLPSLSWQKRDGDWDQRVRFFSDG